MLAVWASEPTPGATVAFDDVVVNSGSRVETLTPPTPPERWRPYW